MTELTPEQRDRYLDSLKPGQKPELNCETEARSPEIPEFKISDAIAQLEALKEQHGDMPIAICYWHSDYKAIAPESIGEAISIQEKPSVEGADWYHPFDKYVLLGGG